MELAHEARVRKMYGLIKLTRNKYSYYEKNILQYLHFTDGMFQSKRND